MSLSKNFPPVMSLYHSTVPPFILFLRNLHAILTKAQAHASSQGIPESYYLNARLFPDMHGLISQIQRVSDISRLAVRRIGDLQLSPMEDNETNINEMKERLEKTIKVLEDVKEEDLAGKDEKEVDVYLPAKKVTWKPKAAEYVNRYVMPNFYFHVTTAYAILRHCGVPVGKDDYMGSA